MAPGVWIARGGLLACVVVHVVLTIQLTRENRAAREQRYGVNATIQASKSSRIMILSGLTHPGVHHLPPAAFHGACGK